MKISIKDILKLVISLGLTVWVLFYISDMVNWAELKSSLLEVKYEWVGLSIALSIISHWMRAYRWKLLLQTDGYQPRTFTVYMSLMIGYLANMLFPRLGEVVRCTTLSSEEDIPLSFSVGTVVTDRLLDLLMLGLATSLLLVLDFDLLSGFFVDFVNEKTPRLLELLPFIIAAGILGLAALIWLTKKARQTNNERSVFFKINQFVFGLFDGMKAIAKVEKQAQFWLSTFGIWGLYFLMLYIISFGYAPTDDMSLTAGLAVLVMGSLGMATPVNNGIGAYQAFVAKILVLYGIAEQDGFTFAVVSHGSQVAAVVVIGLLSLVILNFRKKRKSVVTKQSENTKSDTTQGAD